MIEHDGSTVAVSGSPAICAGAIVIGAIVALAAIRVLLEHK